MCFAIIKKETDKIYIVMEFLEAYPWKCQMQRKINATSD